MLMDLDHFKNINDTYGHLAGDMVLQDVAKIIQKNIRETDTAARYGGEEFIVLLPNTKKEDAVHLAERMRLSIENHTFPDMQNAAITISIGIAGVPDKDITTEDKIVQCADIALYKSKQNGRNRTVVAEGKALVEI